VIMFSVVQCAVQLAGEVMEDQKVGTFLTTCAAMSLYLQSENLFVKASSISNIV